MTKWHRSLILAAVFSLGVCHLPASQAEPGPEAASIPGVDPTPVREETMSQDKLVDFFEHLKKGTPVELTLDKGKTVKGLYSSYDDYYDSVWIVPKGEQGMFTEKSFKLSGIRHAALWDKKEASKKETTTFSSSTPDDYILMKQDGMK